MKHKIGLIIIVLATSLGSCRKNPYAVRLSGTQVEINIQRLEEDLFRESEIPLRDRVPGLIEKYGSFLQLFSYVVNTGEITSPAWPEYLSMFINDRGNFEAYGAVADIYADISDIEADLGDAFSYYIHYFPGKQVPSVYTCITGFNNSIIVGDSIIGIGLDRYLGPDAEFYGRLGIYKYLTLRMDRPFIVPDCIYAWGVTEWDYNEMDYGSDNLFARMVHEGKLQYFVRRMMPRAEETVIFGFTESQMKFCIDNEDIMWQYLVEHDLLFSTDQFVIKKLTGEAPFTSYFTNESPGRAAVWLGYRMVEQYMKRNPDVSMEQLMGMVDYQHILSGAKYNP